MDDYSQFEFVEARNAPNDHRVVVQSRGPSGGQMHSIGGPGGQRTFIAQPRSPYGQPQHQVIYAHPGFGVGVGAGGSSVLGRMTTGQPRYFSGLMFRPVRRQASPHRRAV